MPSAVWGLDIGHSALKAVRLERSGSVPVLTNFDVIEIEQSEDEGTRTARVQTALAELLRRRKIGSEPVLVSVPGNQTFFRPFALPPAPGSRLASIVSFEARNQIPFPINEVIWDFKRIAPSEAGEIRVGLVAVRRELIDQLLAIVRQSGLRLEAIQVAPLALYNLVSYELGGEGAWLVLDGGARVTDFVVVDGEEFWFRPLPQSGNDLTRALEQKFRMNYDEAEALKLKMGESKQAKKIFQVIEPLLRTFVGDIQRTIGYYKGIRSDAELGRILTVGNAFRLPGMVEFVQQALDIEMTPFKQLNRIRLGPGVDAGWWQEEIPAMTVALGLGLQGLGFAPAALELLPESIRHERMLQKKKLWVAGSVAAALVASVASFLAAGHERRTLGANLGDIKQGLKQAEKYERQFETANKGVPEKEKELAALAKGTARERGWILECLDTLARVGGDGDQAVLGPEAAGGNGVYVEEVRVSRGNPRAAMGGDLDGTVVRWYEKVSGISGGGRGRSSGADPMVAIVKAEVAGDIYKDKNKKQADIAHAQKLNKVLQFSSRIYLTGAGLLKLRDKDPLVRSPIVGAITETKQNKKNGTLTFIPRSGGATLQISRAGIERLAWFRSVFLGAGWESAEKQVDSERVRAQKEQANPENPGVRYRQILKVTLAWIYDDGSTELPPEE